MGNIGNLRSIRSIRSPRLNSIQRRFLAFIIGCVGVRLLLVHLVRKIRRDRLPILGYAALLVAFGFLFIFITGGRKTGIEVQGGKIWWNKLRPIHAFFYLWFACLAFKKDKNSYIPLLLDVVFGLTSFLSYHLTVGSFRKLF